MKMYSKAQLHMQIYAHCYFVISSETNALLVEHLNTIQD